MRPHSDRFAEAARRSRTTVSRVNVIGPDGRVLDRLPAHSGIVTRDRTQAQQQTIEIEVSDPDGTRTPQDMRSLLSPGTRIQVESGYRLDDVDLRVQANDTKSGWAVSNVSTGVLNGVKVDTDGALVLGP